VIPDNFISHSKVNRQVTQSDRCTFYGSAPPEALTLALSSRLHFCYYANKVCVLATKEGCSSKIVLGL